MKGKEPFVVGRKTSRGTTVVVIRSPKAPRIAGPWTVRAVVAPKP